MTAQQEDGTPQSGPSDTALCALLTDIFEDEVTLLSQEAPDSSTAFNPIAIRDLIREAASEGRHPAHLVLGHAEADAYRTFLQEEYGQAAPKDLKDSYFLGLHIVEADTPSKLALSGEKSHDAWDSRLSPLWKEENDSGYTTQAA